MIFKSNMAPISIIVAVDEDGGFGKDGKIPWSFPADMQHFREITAGGVCIMGRKTYEDMHDMVASRKKSKAIATYEAIEAMGSPPTKPKMEPIPKIDAILPGRQSFVVTSNPNYTAEGATAVRGIGEALQSLKETDTREVFVIGGQRMYIEALSWANTIYLTVVKNQRYQCDRFFPIEVLNKHYKIVDGKETEDLYFVTYKRG